MYGNKFSGQAAVNGVNSNTWYFISSVSFRRELSMEKKYGIISSRAKQLLTGVSSSII